MSNPTIIKTVAAFALFLAYTSAMAAGFQTSATSVTGMSRALAGAGISGDGPSDMFSNPAGLMLGEGRDIEVAVYSIQPNAEFENDRSVVNGNTLIATVPNANGASSSLVPNFYYAADINERLRYGVGLTSPFALNTEYDPNWVGRHHTIKSELITVEVNPTLAYQVNEMVSVGGGLTLVQADAEFSRAVGGVSSDSLATLAGDDMAFGFTLGLMGFDEDGRMGFGYRSGVNLAVEGSELTSLSGNTTGAKAKLTLPATAYLSGLQKINDKIDLLGTLRWTDWSKFDAVRIERVGATSDTTLYNWKDSHTYSIGINYHHSDRWTFQAGYAKDESPSNGIVRPQIPDSGSDWLAVGGSYHATDKTHIDFSLVNVITDGVTIQGRTEISGTATSTLNGKYTDTDTLIFAVQLHIDL